MLSRGWFQNNWLAKLLDYQISFCEFGQAGNKRYGMASDEEQVQKKLEKTASGWTFENSNPNVFGKPLNLTETQSIDVLVTLERDEAGNVTYKCPPTQLKFNTGNLEWVWSSDECLSTQALNCSLRFMTNTSSTIWKVRVDLDVNFKSKDGCQCQSVQPHDVYFESVRKEWSGGVAKEEWSEVLAALSGDDGEVDPLAGFIVTIEVEMSIVNMVGFRGRLEIGLDFSVPREDADLLLIVEEQNIFVNCGYLAILSPYFAVTQKNLAEMSKDTVFDLPYQKLSDVDYDQFVDLMHVVYPSRKKVTESNVGYLLILADRFLFHNVLVDVERFLLDHATPDIDVFTKLQWAYTYSMADLQDKCMSELTSFASIKDVLNSPVYSTIPVDILKSLFEKIVQV